TECSSTDVFKAPDGSISGQTRRSSGRSRKLLFRRWRRCARHADFFRCMPIPASSSGCCRARRDDGAGTCSAAYPTRAGRERTRGLAVIRAFRLGLFPVATVAAYFTIRIGRYWAEPLYTGEPPKAMYLHAAAILAEAAGAYALLDWQRSTAMW